MFKEEIKKARSHSFGDTSDHTEPWVWGASPATAAVPPCVVLSLVLGFSSHAQHCLPLPIMCLTLVLPPGCELHRTGTPSALLTAVSPEPRQVLSKK